MRADAARAVASAPGPLRQRGQMAAGRLVRDLAALIRSGTTELGWGADNQLLYLAAADGFSV